MNLNWGGGYSKSEVDTLLNGKSDTSHTHTKSDITDFPTIPTKTSDLTNDSSFITSAIKESSIDVILSDRESAWCLLYGDLLIQYGSASNANQSFNITFSKPYLHNPSVVINYGDDVSYGTPCAVDVVYTTYFTVKQYSASGAWRCNWIAIGKKGY